MPLPRKASMRFRIAAAVLALSLLLAGCGKGSSDKVKTVVIENGNVSRTAAAEFTFFLAVPTMAGASLVKVVKFLADGGGFSGSEVGILLTGCAVAFAVSMLCIRFLMNYVKKHDFKVFGWYRIILGIAVLAYFMLAK